MAPQGVVLSLCLLLLLAPGGLPLASAAAATPSPPRLPPPDPSQTSSGSFLGPLQQAVPLPDMRCFCLPRWPANGRGMSGGPSPSLGRQRDATLAPGAPSLFPVFTSLNPPPPAQHTGLDKRLDSITGNRMTSYKPGREPWRVHTTTTCRSTFVQQFPYLQTNC